jgi:hypothetical protein
MFEITGGKGLCMTFANGWTVSVQFGYGNYCNARFPRPDNEDDRDHSSPNAEVARWKGNGTIDESAGNLLGYCGPDEVAAFITETAALS